MLTRHTAEGFMWVDMEAPTNRELGELAVEFNLDPATVRELVASASKPRAEFHDSYAYVVMHFPSRTHSHTHREQEVDFLIGKDFLITVRYESIDPMHTFSKAVEVASILHSSTEAQQPLPLFFHIARHLYRGIEQELELVRGELRRIEEDIFAGHEVMMVPAISKAARALLNLRQGIEPHRDVLRELESNSAFFGAEFQPFVRELSNQYYRVHNHIMRQTESLHELRETNNSLLSTKQNETMRVLTIMALVTLPLTLIATIFAMDTKEMPIVGSPHDFWTIIAFMLAILVCMFGFFRYKHWL